MEPQTDRLEFFNELAFNLNEISEDILKMRDTIDLRHIQQYREDMGKELTRAFLHITLLKNQFGWDTSESEWQEKLEETVNSFLAEEFPEEEIKLEEDFSKMDF